MPVKEDKISGSYNNKEEWLEELLDGEGALYNGNESDDSDNDDENNNENNEQLQLSQGFTNSCYKIIHQFFYKN